MIKNYIVNTLIPDMNWGKIDDFEIVKQCKILNIKNIRCIEHSTEVDIFWGEVCYDYVFGNTDYDYSDNPEDYLFENYKQIGIKEIKKGDIITYYNDNGYELTHYAKIHRTNGTLRGTIIRSKWGNMGIYETDLYSIPKEYGNIIRIWRKI